MKYKVWGNYRVYEDSTIQRISTGRTIQPSDNYKGYKVFRGKVGNEWKTLSVHRVVCLAWHGDPPDDGEYYEADHIDLDRQNNHKDNLQWLTKSQNNQKTWNAGRKNNTGEYNGRCKTDEDDVIKICELLQEGLMPAKIRDMGYDYGIVRSVRSRRNWKSISKDYTW